MRRTLATLRFIGNDLDRDNCFSRWGIDMDTSIERFIPRENIPFETLKTHLEQNWDTRGKIIKKVRSGEGNFCILIIPQEWASLIENIK